MRTLALLLLVSAAVFAQPASDRNCAVDGTVVNSVTGAPIARAHVSILAGDDTFSAESDASGKWSADHVTCSLVIVAVNRVGFRLSRKNPVNPSVLLVANSPVHGVKLVLAPQAVLAGRVVDDEGDPIIGVQVSLMTSRVIRGIRGVQASTSAMTDDRGEYRFAGLADGEYILCANAGGGVVINGGTRPYAEKCYPGPATSSPSSVIDVPEGYEGRVDFQLSPVTTVRVSGVVSGQPQGAAATVSLIPRTQIARMSLGLSARIQPDGSFVITRVPSGSYTAFATSERMSANAAVEVGTSPVDSVQLHLEAGTTVAGTLKIVSATERKPARAPNLLMSRDASSDGVSGSFSAVWDASNTSFTVAEVPAGTYRVDVAAPDVFYVKSMTVGGRDIAASGVVIGQGTGNIEIVIADDGGVIEGDVTADDGPAPAWVLVQKDGVAVRNARADATGHFKIDTVPPGDYKAYAWDDSTNVEYANPDWMQRNGKGVAVSVGAGQNATVKLSRQTAPVE